ncbi:PE-PPE domain-containing protein [Gordonia oryzae]|uniref:PE-PPE domain-containing protein n=1 Tax=Gordonia oryzae TaxID=2487349 RepID=A0A3N4GL47_9ACTN|nr:PE-PPE domain-containing protein [Gordonia oryzae]RPA59400.1 PE-PPE domain-containing protein [Gordonia oryzae]
MQHLRTHIVLLTSTIAVLAGLITTAPAHAAPARSPATAQATTVLTCQPLDFNLGDLFNLMNTTLSGFAPSHGTPVTVTSNSDLTMAGLIAGRDALNTAIMNTPGKKIIFGYSRGAQIASEWLRYYAKSPDAPAAGELSFVLIGNPQRRLGGAPGMTLDGVQLLATPDNTKYTVTDLSRRWDGWANTDNWPDGASVSASNYLNTVGRWIIHSNYTQQSINSPANMTRAVVGHTTYVVTP